MFEIAAIVWYNQYNNRITERNGGVTVKEGWLTDFFSSALHIIQTIEFVDVVDILAVSVLLYYAYKFVRDRRAGKLAAGVLLLFIGLLVSDFVGMHAIQYFFSNLFQVGLIALVVLFQPELRSALEKMGGSSLKGFKSITDRGNDNIMLAVREVSTAAAEMSASRTGALIVFERGTKLGEISSTGTVIDAQTNSFLLRNIFYNKAPLHDGAVIIRNGRVNAAGCLLPLSAQDDINRDLGTRHRAAIGLSENSDAVVVVVSEETGVISVVENGNISRGYSAETLRQKLGELLYPSAEREGASHRRRSLKKRTADKGKAAKEEDDADEN